VITRTAKKRGGRKRSHVKQTSPQSYAQPEWLPVFAPLSPVQQPPLRYSLDKPVSEVLGELLVDVVAEVIKKRWKEVAPGSYAANQLVYAVAPYCRPEASGLLNLAALITAGYGLKQIADAEGH